MKKTFKLENLDCANCAAKMEIALGKIAGMSEVSISFMTQRLTFDAAEDKFDELLEQAQKSIKKFEPNCRIVKGA